MALFRYEAVTLGGDLVQGEMEGPDRDAVVARLQGFGQLPIRAEPARSASRGSGPKPVSKRELVAFTRELSTLLHAGLPLDRALQVIVDASQEEATRRLARSLQEKVRGGLALSQALAAHPRSFDAFYVNMVRAAEAAGALDAGLSRLADYEERSKALRDSLLSALVYPAILAVVAAGSLLVILAYVVPQFSQMFADAGQALPLATEVVIGAAALLRDYWWAIAACVAAAALALRRELASEAGRYRWDGMLLRLPLAGELVRRVQMARFARSLAALLGSGVSLLAGLGIAKELLSNRVLADAVDLAVDGLKAGGGLAAPLLSTGLFPALGLQMIKVGEETGRLEEMLQSVGETYEREIAAALQRLLALLEPLLIVGLGLVIAGVIMSLLAAIVAVNDLPI